MMLLQLMSVALHSQSLQLVAFERAIFSCQTDAAEHARLRLRQR